MPEVAIAFLIFEARSGRQRLFTSRADKTTKPFQFAFAGRIVTKEFIGQANRAQRQRLDLVSRMCPPGKRSAHNSPPRDLSLASGKRRRAAGDKPEVDQSASSTPEIISTRHPVAERTHSKNAWELRASRMALVATTRTESVTTCCVAR